MSIKKEAFKKFLVLGILFVFPLVIYLFFASGINNFARLPILTEEVNEISAWSRLSGDPIQFENKISIVGFWGSDLVVRKADAFNLNQKIYKRFYQFVDFQFVMVVENGQEEMIKQVLLELQAGAATDLSKWKFIFGSKEEIQLLYESFNTDIKLNENKSTSTVFIVDRAKKLRGRDDDEEVGTLYGYNSSSVAELNKKMTDDVKVILAEYRLALKKNNSNRSK
ncbi:hypothetical protein OAP39_01355 [Flavobacteriaceae bacterium]|jgi:hypothetical protein|nr:hypothetical protein [Flavobacteriaceae bacterium]